MKHDPLNVRGHRQHLVNRKVKFPALPGVRTDARPDKSQATPTGVNGHGTHDGLEAAFLHVITAEPEAFQ